MTVTRDDILKGQVRCTGHMNFGRDGSGYPHQHVQYPRVGFIDRLYKGKAAEKAGKRSERIWTLDGKQMDSLDAVVAGLATPPVLSDDEKAVLDRMPTEFRRAREVEAEIGASDEGRSVRIAMMLLSAKGLIEYGREPCEPTDLQKDLGLEHMSFHPTVRRRPS